MIVDFHSHIFPPEVRDRREEYLRREPTFAEMYGQPNAKIARTEDLLRSMDEAGVDVSVALGFAWRDSEQCRCHNDYLLESAAASKGRIVPFCTVNPAVDGWEEEAARCAREGAPGMGELRPQSQGWDPAGPVGDRLADAAVRHGLTLLFHVTEPAGRSYPGKRGGDLAAFYEFAVRHPQVVAVGAHLAGGLPFYAAMPEVRDAFANLYVDTAAQPFLYRPDVYEQLLSTIGPERVLMGSDFPLLSQKRQVEEIRSAVPDTEAQRLILGGNAQRLLREGHGHRPK